MKNFAKKLSAMALCTVFASMQITAMAFDAVDTGLGKGLGGANITNATGGYLGTTTGGNSATVNVKGDTHVTWGNLNLNSNETLNFNGTTGANATVVNSVTSGMSQIYGTITANDGVAKLIISNPNGMLFDGSTFTTTGDVLLTTQGLNPLFDANGKIVGFESVGVAGDKSTIEGFEDYSVIIRNNSKFNVGGEFNITAPSINIIRSAITSGQGVKFITADGQNYLVSPIPGMEKEERHNALRLESVKIDGDVYIVSGRDKIYTANGGIINGNLDIHSDGNVALNYTNNGEQLVVNGNVNVNNDGRVSYLRNSQVNGNLDMTNSGGFVEINDVEVTGDANLTTTLVSNVPDKPGRGKTNHFIHVVGDNNIGGNMNINSAHNIHIGGYSTDPETDMPSDIRQTGSLTVGGDLNAKSDAGTIAVTVDTAAKNVKMDAGLNIISNGNATITAKTYEFTSKNFIGSLTDEDAIVDTMENYVAIPTKGSGEYTYLNVAGGDVNKVKTGFAFIKSENDMNVNGVDVNKIRLTSDQHDIVIGEDVHANLVQVGGETRKLKVEFPGRDYTLEYTNIKDNVVKTINSNDEITYELTNGENGYNQGTQTAQNTYLVGPDKPVTPPGPDEPTPPGPVDPDDPTPPGPDEPTPPGPVDPDDPTPPTPADNDNVKVLRGYERDQISDSIVANEVYTPVAFAADLDDEIDTGVRKNVDGSVTVVRAYTPSN